MNNDLFEAKMRYKRVKYKEIGLRITVISRNYLNYRRLPFETDSSRAFYIGEITSYPKGRCSGKRKSFESIHYDKVIAKFKRFVDEYCTNWVVKAILQYKGYEIKICREVGCKNFYIGYVKFHQNSIYKYIADTREEVEVNCKNRINRVVKEKEKVQMNLLTPKQEKIQELEQLQAKISAQLEELKNEKETLEYKGVILEISKKKDSRFEGIILSKTKNLRTFNDLSITRVTKNFVSYIDELEEVANLYSVLTGKELK